MGSVKLILGWIRFLRVLGYSDCCTIPVKPEKNRLATVGIFSLFLSSVPARCFFFDTSTSFSYKGRTRPRSSPFLASRILGTRFEHRWKLSSGGVIWLKSLDTANLPNKRSVL